MQERGGGRVTPHTARAVTAISDGERAVKVLFLEAGGGLSDREQSALDLIHEAGRLVSEHDLLRRIGDWVRDAGELPGVLDISPYLKRQWSELNPADDTA